MMRFWRWAALLGVAGLDAVAVAGLFGASLRGDSLAAGAVGHMAVCCASTWTMFAGDGPWRRGGWRLRALGFSVAFFMPVLGGPGLLMVLSAAFGARPAEAPKWSTIPIDDDRFRGIVRGQSRLALDRVASLLQTRTPETTATRFRALLLVPRFAPRESVAILRACLKDPFDEVRLYAFARLERLRDGLESRTRRLMQHLQSAASDEQQMLHLRIAESRWETCYLGLAEGAVLDDAIEGARHHATQVLRLCPRNAAASFLLGRVHLRSRNYPAATQHFQTALDAGFPAIRVLPYLAEAHFEQRDYVSVKMLMRDLARLSSGHTFPGGVIEFWR